MLWSVGTWWSYRTAENANTETRIHTQWVNVNKPNSTFFTWEREKKLVPSESERRKWEVERPWPERGTERQLWRWSSEFAWRWRRRWAKSGFGFFFFLWEPLIFFVSCIRAINYLLFLVLFCWWNWYKEMKHLWSSNNL